MGSETAGFSRHRIRSNQTDHRRCLQPTDRSTDVTRSGSKSLPGVREGTVGERHRRRGTEGEEARREVGRGGERKTGKGREEAER